MGNLYSDYLPYVLGDTDSNISNRVEGCVKNILQGEVRELDGHPEFFYVGDGYGYEHMINLAYYSINLKPLTDIMGKTIQTNYIQQLEREVETLKFQLKDAYNYRSY